MSPLAQWFRDHSRALVFSLAVLVGAGLFAGSQLPVTLFPHVDFPRIVVSIEAGDRPADRMAMEVTRVAEEALRGVPGVERIRSSTSRGSAEISLSFGWGSDMVASLLLVESALSRIAPTLPAQTLFEVRRMDPTVFPVLAYSISSPTRSLMDLRELAELQLRPVVATVPGVARATVLGGRQREYHVTLDIARLEGYRLSPRDVADALAASNVIQAVGRIDDLSHLYLVIAESETTDLEALGSVVVRSGPTGTVLVEDVAALSVEAEPAWTRVTADGRDAVLLAVHQQPEGNTVSVARDVRALLEERAASLPADVRIVSWYDQSDLILASAVSVRDSVLIGVALACLVLLVFLRSWRIAVIALIAVPAVLATSVVALWATGLSFNIMTLGGMAAAIGLIIDDVIVVLEHVVARRGQASALQASAELTRPLVFSSLVTVIVFVPLGLLSGVTGEFFAALAVTMSASLVASFFVSWIVVPIVADRLLPAARDGALVEHSGGRVGHAYHRGMTLLLAHPSAAFLIVAPLLGLGAVAYAGVQSGFMPSTDEGGFVLDYRAAPGLSLEETDRLLRELETILGDVPEVASYSRRTGAQMGGGLTEANQGDYFIRLGGGPRRDVEEVMSEIRSRIEARVPGLQVEMMQLMEDLIGDLTAVPQPIELEFFSEDPAALQAGAHALTTALESVPGVVDINDGVIPAGDALHLEIDPVRASLEGTTPEAISTELAALIGGVVATSVVRDARLVGVRVWIPFDARNTALDLEALRLRAPDGHTFPLRRVAQLRRVSGDPQITRDDLRRVVAVTARISGRDMGSVMRDVEARLVTPTVHSAAPDVRIGGLYAEQQAAFAGLAAVCAAAVLLVFLVLLFAFESFRVAFAMILVALFALSAVLIGLWATNTPLNISSMMGLTMVVGIVTEVGVFYVSDLQTSPHEDLRAALIASAASRARPIVMTTVAAILALTPLALAIGEGASMQQPLAIAIVSGLVAQVPLVLVVLPALLAVLRARPAARPSSALAHTV